MRSRVRKMRVIGCVLILTAILVGALATAERQAAPERRRHGAVEAANRAWDEYRADHELIPLNTADYDQLICIPGVGDATARAILAYRAEHGSFSSEEEVLQIEGVSDDLLAALWLHTTVDDGAG